MKSDPLSFIHSRWIWPESHSWDLHNGYALFRKEFELSGIAGSHPLIITADQSYQLYINGRYVCRGPARGFQSSWPFDEIDVGGYLRKGENLIAVRAHNPGFGNFQYISSGFAGFILAMKKSGKWIVTDESWRCRRQDGVKRDTVPTSLQLFCQEHIDLQKEDPEWMTLDFDDSHWSGEIASHPWNGMPWHTLEPRGIPMLNESEVAPALVIGRAKGICGDGYEDCRDVAALRSSESMSHKRCALPPGELIIPPTGKGRFRSFLIDYGRTVVGCVGFDISGTRGGEILDTLHVETIDAETLTPHFIPHLHCRMAFSHRLVCRSESGSHTFYHAFGFRYMVLTLRDTTTTLVVRPKLRTALYPLERKGTFSSSEADLNGIWETCAWTQQCCSMDAFVDTPWREQAQYWGDARIQAKNTFFLSGDTRLFRRGISQIAAQTTPEGLTYSHAPTTAHECILPDFTLTWLITLWDCYWQSGSLESFQNHQAAIEKALGYFEGEFDSRRHLLKYDPRYWLFLDWTETTLGATEFHRNGYSTVYNLWLLVALDRLSALFRLSGMMSKADRLSAWAAKLRTSLSNLVRKDGLLSDGLTWKGRSVPSASVHAQTLAVMTGLQPQFDQPRLDRLLAYVSEPTGVSHPPSAFWSNYVLEILTERGFRSEALAFIRRKWTPMVKHGTTWEVFQPIVGEWSHSHAWSAHPLYHLMQIVGGIRQTKPAWREILFQPHFEGEYCRTTVPVPGGLIRCEWTRSHDHTDVELSLPPGTSARILLPGVKTKLVRGNCSWKIQNTA